MTCFTIGSVVGATHVTANNREISSINSINWVPIDIPRKSNCVLRYAGTRVPCKFLRGRNCVPDTRKIRVGYTAISMHAARDEIRAPWHPKLCTLFVQCFYFEIAQCTRIPENDRNRTWPGSRIFNYNLLIVPKYSLMLGGTNSTAELSQRYGRSIDTVPDTRMQVRVQL